MLIGSVLVVLGGFVESMVVKWEVLKSEVLDVDVDGDLLWVDNWVDVVGDVEDCLGVDCMEV